MFPSPERIRQLLSYDKETGVFVWKMRTSNRIKVGQEAGRERKDPRGYSSYVDIGIDGFRWPAHRLAWAWMTGEKPENDIDHIDRNGMNNAWGNLRAATRSQNLMNTGVFAHNTSGYKGVSYRKDTKKWSAYIQVNSRKICLGCFNDAKKAHEARLAYAVEEFGEYHP